LKTGEDIYGNNVDEMGKMISFLDIATLGMSKMGWMKTLKSNSIVKGLERTNFLTTLYSTSTYFMEKDKQK